MTYSFTVRASTKEELKTEVALQFDLIRLKSPAHNTDYKQAIAAANLFIDMLEESNDMDLVASVYGNINGFWNGNGFTDLKGVNASISVGSVIKRMYSTKAPAY